MVHKVENSDKSYKQITKADEVQQDKRDLKKLYPTSAGALYAFTDSVMDAEALVTCPYNKAHRVSQRRLARHLLKCEKNHTQTTLVHCKFDTTHIVDRMEYEHHMATCPSSGHIRADKYVKESDAPVGYVGLEDINHIYKNITNTEENWDEIDNSGNTYNPEHNLSTRNVFRMCIAGSKAQKKKFKNMERERFMKLQENIPSETSYRSIVTDTDLDTPLRSPRQPANVCSQTRPSKQLNKSTCSEKMDRIEDVLADISVDNITSLVQTKLSLTPTSCNNSMKAKAEFREDKNAKNSTDRTGTSPGSIDIGINSRVSKIVDADQSVLENVAILKVQEKSNLRTTDDKTVDVAKVMAQFSTGRGLTRAHRDLREYIERKPGAPLRRPKQQAAAVLQSQQVDDTEKFSDNV